MTFRSLPWTKPAFYALALTFVLAMSAQAEPPRPEISAGADALLASILEADRGTGVTAAVVVGGDVVWSGAVGHADVENDLPLGTDHRLRIGSVSKTLTAALVARLAADGVLDLDASVRRQVPELPETWEPITIRHLVNHTGGVRHYDFRNLADANNMLPVADLADTLPRFAGDPLVAAPGTKFHYTSIGYNVLGLAAQRAAGQPFLDALRTKITAPLGLDDIVGDEPLELVPRRSRFYTIRPQGPPVNTIWRDSSDYYPAGGLLATAGDLARFAWELFAGPKLQGSVRELATTRQHLDDGTALERVFGWEIETREDAAEGGRVVFYGHGGETNGCAAILRYYPEHDLAVAGIANYNFWFDGEPRVYEGVGRELAEIFFADAETSDH